MRNEQEAMVESYLDENPWSTVVDVRDGILAESGIKIERVQARLDAIGKRRKIEKDSAEHGRVAYRLGKDTSREKLLGVEATLWLVDGEIEIKVHGQKVDLHDQILSSLQTDLVSKLSSILQQNGAKAKQRLAPARRVWAPDPLDGLLDDDD